MSVVFADVMKQSTFLAAHLWLSVETEIFMCIRKAEKAESTFKMTLLNEFAMFFYK